MEISLNAQVECTDGFCGRAVYVLINPVNDQVTHLVIKKDSVPNTEYIVPVDFLVKTAEDLIRLRCSRAELEMMDPFVQKQFIQERVPDFSMVRAGLSGMGSYYYLPYATPDVTVYEAVETQQIPPGELAVRRGTRVEATDGYVGRVDEFLVNPENSYITHLVLREGHLWGKKDVIIPLSAMSAMGDTSKNTVFLKIDKQQVESLPTFPVHRRWS